MAALIDQPGRDVHDRLRRPRRLRRAAVRAARSRERHRTEPPRVRGPPRRRRPGRAARLAPRPALRRLERDPDLPAQRGHAQARDRRALRRRRRRAVRRLRALRRRAGRAPLRRPAGGPLRERPAPLDRRCRPRRFGGKAGSARSASPASPARGLPDAYRCWISFIARGGSRRPARRAARRLGARGLRATSGAAPRAPTRSTACSTSTCAPTSSTTCSSRPTG